MIFWWFLNRAKKLSSNSIIYNKEVLKLKEKIVSNIYPEKFFTDILRNFEENLSNSPKDKLSQCEFKILIKVPCIRKVTFEFKKKLENLITKYVKDFKVIYTTTKISKYFSNKENTPHEFKSNIVYEYKGLKDQDIRYIGYTSRLLIERTN